MATPEGEVTKHARILCAKNGIGFFKMSDRYKSGWPDSVMIYNGETWFVELKRPNTPATPLQKAIGSKIISFGGKWICLSGKDQVTAFIARLTGLSVPASFHVEAKTESIPLARKIRLLNSPNPKAPPSMQDKS